MFIKSVIKYFYLAITLLAIITPSNIGFLNYLPGLLLMWLFFLIFSNGFGFKLVTKSNQTNTYTNKYALLIITLIFPIFYNYYALFYTNMSLLTAVTNLFSGVSNYNLYQTFFNESELNVFSLNKIPYILGHGVLKFLFFTYLLKIIVYNSRRSFFEIACLFFMSLVIVLCAFARGTSFEFFELFFMYLFSYLLKLNFLNQSHSISKKFLFKIAAIVILVVALFTYNIQLRMGEDFDFSNIPDFNKNSVLYKIFPLFSLMLFSLNDYFLFGIQYISIVIIGLSKSFFGIFAILLPNGIQLLGIDISYKDYVSKHIEIGAKWSSDLSIFMDKYGFPISLFIIFLIGFVGKKICKSRFFNLNASIILFYIMFFMISFPLGNFITNSSATIITICISTSLFLLDNKVAKSI